MCLKLVIALILLAVPVTAQQPTPDDLRRAQERLAGELQAVKKESTRLREEADARAAKVTAIQSELQASKAASNVEIERLKSLLTACQVEVADRDREIAKINKNIKRRALIRIFTFQW